MERCLYECQRWSCQEAARLNRELKILKRNAESSKKNWQERKKLLPRRPLFSFSEKKPDLGDQRRLLGVLQLYIILQKVSLFCEILGIYSFIVVYLYKRYYDLRILYLFHFILHLNIE